MLKYSCENGERGLQFFFERGGDQTPGLPPPMNPCPRLKVHIVYSVVYLVAVVEQTDRAHMLHRMD